MTDLVACIFSSASFNRFDVESIMLMHLEEVEAYGGFIMGICVNNISNDGRCKVLEENLILHYRLLTH